MALEARLTSRGRILKQTTETIEVTVYNDGTAADPTGTPTYTIKDASNTTVQSGSVTVPGASSGKLTAALAAQTNLGQLTLTVTGTWNAATQVFTIPIEVVGGHLFTEYQARQYDGAAMATTPGDADIALARDRITDLIWQNTGVSWTPRGRRLTFDGNSQATLLTDTLFITRVVAGSIDGTALTADELADLAPYKDGRIVRKTLGVWGEGYQNVILDVEFGKTVLEDGVDETALQWLRKVAVDSNLPKTAIQQVDQLGTFRLAVASARFPSGIPDVDAWIATHDQRLGVA